MSIRSPWAPGALWLVAAGLLAILAAISPLGQPGPDLEKLYNEHRFLELRTSLESETRNTLDILFYRGVTANAFNRPAESADFLTELLQAAGDRLPANALRDSLLALDDDYARMFEYAKAAAVRERLEPILEKDIGRSTYAAFKSILGLWRAIASAPPQTVEIPGDTEIALTGEGEVRAEINGLEVALLADTGSALSMIVRPVAERAGLRILDVTVEVGTATGKIIKARPCLVPELRLAGITVRNAVFLVVPEEMFYFPVIGQQRSGLLGFPVLAGLKELTFSRDGKLGVNSPPRLQGPPNIFLAGSDPVVEANYQGRRLLLFLDTGAYETELFPHFFKAFEPEIVKRGVYVPATLEGVGSRSRTPVYLVDGLSFRVAGQDVIFDKRVPVLTKSTSADSGVFDGSFSLDILTGHRELTLNYEAMRLALR